MFVINVKSLDFAFDGEEGIFHNLSLSLNKSETVGLVGPNGSGKSTLIKLINGEIAPSMGSIQAGKIGYLPQDPNPADLNKTLRQIISQNLPGEDWRGDLAMDIAGLKEVSTDLKLRGLSGGQVTRFGLGILLAQEEVLDVLILDEPTNNLDREGLDWLNGLIREYKLKGLGVLIASHEREFLDRVADRIVAIEDASLANYSGGYSNYKLQLEAKLKTKQEEYDSYKLKSENLRRRTKVQHNHLESKMRDFQRARKNKVSAKNKFSTSSVKCKEEISLVQTRIGKKIRAIHSKERQLDEVLPPDREQVLDVRLNADIPSSKLILRAVKLSKKLGNKIVLDNLDLELRGPVRVQIRGKNGSGKSTLLSVFAAKLKPESGELIFGEGLRLGYFSQGVYGLNLDQTAAQSLSNPEKDMSRIYTLLIKAGIDKASADKKLREISRGQQARVGFVKLMLTQPDVLILDEPTNHLDIATKEAIEKALDGFSGAIIFASHDQYFVKRINPDKIIDLPD